MIRLLLALLLLLSGCTSSYPVNEPLLQADTSVGYRPSLSRGIAGNSDSLRVIMAFSGGGTRAAAFSYGVLEALRDTTIHWEGSDRRLLTEIDMISSVSGGSFTAAYFGLFGDRIFEDYQDKFLNANVQGHLTWSVFKPWNWFRLGSRLYGRSEYAASYYDDILFEGKTFADMMMHGGPVIQINATEVATATQFTFTQDLFDPLCSDLGAFSISRAVAASSAVPVLFSSITLNNYAGSCNYQLPSHIVEALNERDPTSRTRHTAKKYSQYLDSETHAYLHLYDGGLTDNLGVRAPLRQLRFAGGGLELAQQRGGLDLKRLLIVVVNAQAEANTSYSRRASGVPLLATITGATSIPLNGLTFDSLVAVKHTLDEVREQFTIDRCAHLAEMDEGTEEDCADFKAYLVYLDLDQLADKDKADRLKHLPTSFVLEPQQVDELREAARTVLLGSEEFKRFLNDMH